MFKQDGVGGDAINFVSCLYFVCKEVLSNPKLIGKNLE